MIFNINNVIIVFYNMVEVLFNIKVIGIVFDNEIKIVCEYCVGII